MLVCMNSGKQYEVDLLGAVDILAHAWKEVKETTVYNCFCHEGFLVSRAAVTVDAERTADGEPESSLLAAALLANGVGWNTYQSIDDNVSTCWKDTFVTY